MDFDAEEMVADLLSEQMMAEENSEAMDDDLVALKIKRSDIM